VIAVFRGSVTLWALLLLGAAGVVRAECEGDSVSALTWLEKMSHSGQEVSYHGVVTLQHDGEMQVIQVSHALGKQDESTAILTELTGQGAQVSRGKHPLHCEHPGQSLLRLGERLQQGECGIADYYRFRIEPGDRVAGRKSVRIRIEPRDMYRHGYVMALDKKTGLLLKTETLGHGARSLEKFQFANLALTDRIPEVDTEVELLHEAGHPHPQERSGDAAVSRPWAVNWVPKGFTMTDNPAQNSARRTYTDGLAVFSVFLEELEQPIQPGEGLVRQGGTTSYTRGMQLSKNPVLVTVLGEVPTNTLRMVADSITWAQ
jgi:sigma-E factor negative regulatory protein RseB